MAIDILRLRGPVAKLREQRAAFLGGPSDDVIGGGAQQQRLAPGLVRPDQRTLLAGRALPELNLVVAHLRRHVVLRALGAVNDAKRLDRSEERRVGKACVSTCRSRWSPYH